MQLSVSGHHIEITEHLRDYVGNKLAKLERHFDHMTNVHCILTVEKLSFIAHPTKDGTSKWIDFPFQKNIHQLPQADFLECLSDLHFKTGWGRERTDREIRDYLGEIALGQQFRAPGTPPFDGDISVTDAR